MKCQNNCGKEAQHGLRMYTDKPGESATFGLCRSCAVAIKKAMNWPEVKTALAPVTEAEGPEGL